MHTRTLQLMCRSLAAVAGLALIFSVVFGIIAFSSQGWHDSWKYLLTAVVEAAVMVFAWKGSQQTGAC